MSSDWQNGPTASTYNFSGCAWTGKDVVAASTTTVTPQDFTKQAPTAPYAISGSVTADPLYNGVALLGFNLAEPQAGASCTYNPASATNPVGPPEVPPPTGATGIAVNFAKSGAFTLRVQIQGKAGATDANNRWCYTITAAAGPVFAPLNQFYTSCWNVGSTTGASPGTAYSGQAISAVVFTVPGNTAAQPYNFTINGWAFGTSAAAAPTGGVVQSLTGTIGGPGVTDLDFQRVKVAAGGHSYIIQNNNWGSPTTTDQTLTYKDNSYTITSPTGNGNTSGAPASFPSIYIGANGNTANGVYDTKSDDNLPKLVSTIQSVQTTFSYSTCSGTGYNATYDVWFAASPPTATYNDAISGFVMVWLCKPSNAQPIGSQQTTATIAGHTWNVWVGPRGGTGTNSGAPVVSYVAQSSFTSFTFDLNLFIKDAASHGILSSWYLTDVFAGFEIWNGSATQGLQETAFTCVVQ
jgi:hypothetical protein